MKKTIKPNLQKPSETESRVWYPYEPSGGQIKCIEWIGDDDLNTDDLYPEARFTLSEIVDCVNQIANECKVSTDSVSIKCIVLECEEDATLEFSVFLKKNKDQFQKEMEVYNKAQLDYENELWAWKEFQKNEKIRILKKELENLENEQ